MKTYTACSGQSSLSKSHRLDWSICYSGEWHKIEPWFRLAGKSGRQRKFASKEAAMRAARRLGLTVTEWV